MDLDETLSWPFFDDGHRRFAQALARWADATLPALPHDDVDAACRARVKALGGSRFSQGGGAGGARRAASAARRAHALPGPRNPGVPRRARRFRLCHAGPGHRLDLAVRLDGAAGALSPAGARRTRHRGLRPVGAGGGLRRRRAGDDGDAGRAVASAPRRREDLDLQRRHRRPLRRVRPHRRRRRRQGAVGVRGRCRCRRACRSWNASR